MLGYVVLYSVAINVGLVAFWFIVQFGTRAVLAVLRAEGVIP